MQRLDAMKKFVQNINSTPEALELLSNWGLRLDQNALQVYHYPVIILIALSVLLVYCVLNSAFSHNGRRLGSFCRTFCLLH